MKYTEKTQTKDASALNTPRKMRSEKKRPKQIKNKEKDIEHVFEAIERTIDEEIDTAERDIAEIQNMLRTRDDSLNRKDATKLKAMMDNIKEKLNKIEISMDRKEGTKAEGRKRDAKAEAVKKDASAEHRDVSTKHESTKYESVKDTSTSTSSSSGAATAGVDKVARTKKKVERSKAVQDDGNSAVHNIEKVEYSVMKNTIDMKDMEETMRNEEVVENGEVDKESSTKKEKKSGKALTEDVCAANTKTRWEDYNLKREIMVGIQQKKFSWPSPIQAEAIPHSLSGKDIVARAKNGTGKAGAFIIPLLNKVDAQSNVIQALILVPTRELVLQTVKVCREIGRGLRIRMFPLYGGFSPKDDIIRLRDGAHIIVGTPGRVLDFIEQKVINLSSCRHLVCDEADKLLSNEFQEVLYKITEILPKQRQIELYSATFPFKVQDYMEKYMSKPVVINLMKDLVLSGVKQYYAYVRVEDKLHCLKTLLMTLDINQCFIFCNSISTAEKLAKRITEIGFTAYFIHSKMKQEERNMVFHNFTTKGECRILVATDLVTRGIDVPSVNVVINFDLPRSVESYLHRIGRSGRFGTQGSAINMITQADKTQIEDIEMELGVQLQPYSKQPE